MKIVDRMSSLKKRFDYSIKEFEELQSRISEIQNEQRTMQGEYKVLLELGIEAGVLDMDGNPITQDDIEDTVVKEAK